MKIITRKSHSGIFLIVIAIWAWMPAAHADATFCVKTLNGTTDGLIPALNAWSNSTTDDVYRINLTQNTFVLKTGLSLGSEYTLSPLVLSGGWNANCTKKIVDATTTRIQGHEQNMPVDSYLAITSNASIEIENLTFAYFTAVNPTANQGIAIQTLERDAKLYFLQTANIWVHHCIAEYVKGGISLSGYSTLRLQDSAFFRNSPGVELNAYGDDAHGYVTNNTFASNDGAGLVLVTNNGSSRIDSSNNIGYLNSFISTSTKASDLIVDQYGQGVITVKNSDFQQVTGDFTPLPPHSNFDPSFTDAGSNDFSLAYVPANPSARSLAIDAGTDAPAGGAESTDVLGNPRRRGTTDLGAYESSYLASAQSATVVTSTSDSVSAPSQTLRAAILAADQSASPSTITFNLPGGSCPQIITLTGALLDITRDVTIDGSTQPGAGAPPSGQPCIVLRAPNTGLAHALRSSGSGRLTVHGIEFEGFGSAGSGGAVDLAADHSADTLGDTVTGNTFSTFPGSRGNARGVLIEASAANARVGGYGQGQINSFDQSTDAAIYVDQNVPNASVPDKQIRISNNFIGYGFTSGLARNAYGIYLNSAAGVHVTYNYVGGAQFDGIEVIGANASANLMQGNNLGMDGNAVAGNLRSGIRLSAGAFGNVIGQTADFPDGGNTIVGNGGPGVWMVNGVGIDNRVVGANTIYGNGADVPRLAIDLGDEGPNLADQNDADTGPNNLQNPPTLTEAARVGPREVAVAASLLVPTNRLQGYRMDVFWTDACVPAFDSQYGRGEMKRYIGYIIPNSSDTGLNSPEFRLKTLADIPTTGYLFATAKDNFDPGVDAAGSTSEPGPCAKMISDPIFKNGFDVNL